MVAKAGLGIIGLGAISVGGIALANPSWIGMGDHMSHWTPLSKDHDFSSNTGDQGIYKGKFGETYKNYLTGVVGTNSQQGSKNTTESWWEWSFKRLKEDSLKTSGSSFTPSDKFKYSTNNNDSKVNHAISSDAGEKGLNQICKQAYQAENGNVTSTATDSDTTKFKEADVWRYCSPIGQKPKTISSVSEEIYGEQTIGGKKSSELISIKDKGNDWFWKIRDWELTGSKDFTKITVSSPGTEDYFSKQLGKKHIKDLCEEAYRSSSPGTSGDAQPPKPTEEITKKYCSLSITQQTQ